MEFGTFCCDRLTVINVFPSNTTNLLNLTRYSTCFSRPRPYLGLKVHLGLTLHTLMPKDGWGWPKHVASSIVFNKFVALDSSKSIPIYISGDIAATLVLKITVKFQFWHVT